MMAGSLKRRMMIKNGDQVIMSWQSGPIEAVVTHMPEFAGDFLQVTDYRAVEYAINPLTKEFAYLQLIVKKDELAMPELTITQCSRCGQPHNDDILMPVMGEKFCPACVLGMLNSYLKNEKEPNG